jgi:glycosyltransferase involved in cell wall biosynthesis
MPCHLSPEPTLIPSFFAQLLQDFPESPLRERYAAAGIPVVTFPIGRLLGLHTLRQGLRLRRFLSSRGVDVVHCHDMYSNAFVAPWARAAGAALVTSRRWGPFERRSHAIANRLAYRLSHAVLANSPGVAALVRDEGIAAARVAVVPNFVDAAAFDAPSPAERAAARDALGVPAGAVVVGVVANLTAIKDHAMLLRAMARLAPGFPHAHAVLVGGGPLRDSLDRLARELGVADRVHFAGARPNLPNLHHIFDLSALTSVSEGFPNSIVEAMAAGRAVVATRVGGVADAVAEGETGLLVPSGDDDALAAALGTLLEDPARRAAMGARARERAASRHSADVAITALEQIYARVAPAHRARAPREDGLR